MKTRTRKTRTCDEICNVVDDQLMITQLHESHIIRILCIILEILIYYIFVIISFLARSIKNNIVVYNNNTTRHIDYLTSEI